MFQTLEQKFKEFLKTQEAQAIIAGQVSDEDNEAAAAERASILDRIAALEIDHDRLTEESAKQRPIFEAAQKEMVIQRGRLGALEQQLNASRVALGDLRRSLRTTYGEQHVIDAERHLEYLVRALPKNIELLRSGQKILSGQFASVSGDPFEREKLAVKCGRQLEAAQAALLSLVALKHARLPPAEIKSQCAALLSSAGVDEQGVMQ